MLKLWRLICKTATMMMRVHIVVLWKRMTAWKLKVCSRWVETYFLLRLPLELRHSQAVECFEEKKGWCERIVLGFFCAGTKGAVEAAIGAQGILSAIYYRGMFSLRSNLADALCTMWWYLAWSGSPLHLVFITCCLYHGALIISYVGYLCSLVLLHYWLNNSRSTQLGKCQRKEVRDLFIKAIIFLREVG